MMKPVGSCDGTSKYLGVCDAIDGYVRCDDAGEVVRSKLGAFTVAASASAAAAADAD